MAAGDSIPDDDHVSRGCGERGEEQGVVTSAAFKPRAQDKGKLSVDWVECAHVPPSKRKINGSLERLRRRPLRPQAVAILATKDIRQIEVNGHKLDAVENPHKGNPCHSSIVGMTEGPTGFDLQEDLAEVANSGQVVYLS